MAATLVRAPPSLCVRDWRLHWIALEQLQAVLTVARAVPLKTMLLRLFMIPPHAGVCLKMNSDRLADRRDCSVQACLGREQA